VIRLRRKRKTMISLLTKRSLACLLLLPGLLLANLPYPFPQMVPEEFMQPGFHRSVDPGEFPRAMHNARRDYTRMINAVDADALFERRTFTGSRVFRGEGRFSTQTLDYEIMVPPADAVPPPGGFPLVFTTYGRGRLAEAMALPHFRQNHPAYVVAFLHGERPGPLHAPPVHFDFANLFLEVFDWLFETYPIDQNRVYGSGWSRGGSSMTILSHAYAQRPGYNGIPLITAAVPSAGGFQNLEDNALESIKDVKWFSLQGADDGNSNPRGSEHAFDQLEKAGALDNIFWWIEGTGHSPHSVGWNVADIVEWMFRQTKADLTRRPNAVLNIDVTDAEAPLTFTASSVGSTAHNGGPVARYTWQLFRSREAIAEHSEGYLHGWTLDTGFQDAQVISNQPTISFTLREPGTWWLRVIVEDAQGNRRAVTQKIHARASLPVASFRFSRNYETAGQPIRFSARDSVAEHQAEIQSYAWHFGDGRTATGAEVAHAFAAPGRYTVTLAVRSSQGRTHRQAQTVSVTQAFPGYRYFRFRGLTCHQTYRAPRIDSFAFRVGDAVFPRAPMTSNDSQGISLTATWNEESVWQAFDGNPQTGWTHHNYHTPGGWTMDIGENPRFVPTGVNMTMRAGNNRWTDFDLEASVDGQTWDTLWRRRRAEDGMMNTSGEEILFSAEPHL
jgi:PKD repeat protein